MIHQEAKAANGSCLYVGRDRSGHWVVQDSRCSCGGMFVNQTEAIRFAMHECQRHPRSVILVEQELELEPALPAHNV